MNHPFQFQRLADMLVARGLVSPQQVGDSTESDMRKGERLVSEKILTSEQLAEVLAEQFSLRYVDLREVTIPASLFEKFPAEQAYELNVVPLSTTDECIDFAIANPYSLELPDKLERITGLRVRLAMATAQGHPEGTG